jgi:hypothetical protein
MVRPSRTHLRKSLPTLTPPHTPRRLRPPDSRSPVAHNHPIMGTRPVPRVMRTTRGGAPGHRGRRRTTQDRPGLTHIDVFRGHGEPLRLDFALANVLGEQDLQVCLDRMQLLPGNPLDRNLRTIISRQPPISRLAPNLNKRSMVSLPGLLVGMNPWLQTHPPIPLYLEGSAFRRLTIFQEKLRPLQRLRNRRRHPAMEPKTPGHLILNKKVVRMPVQTAIGRSSRHRGFILMVYAIHPKNPASNRRHLLQVGLPWAVDAKAVALGCAVMEVKRAIPQTRATPMMIT